MLSALQTLIETRLSADAYFVGPPKIEVVDENHGDMTNVLERAMAKIGLGAIILTPAMTPGATPETVEIEIVVKVIEVPIVNRGKFGTGKTAANVAEAVWALLEDWQPADQYAPLESKGLELVAFEPVIEYEVKFSTATVHEAYTA